MICKLNEHIFTFHLSPLLWSSTMTYYDFVNSDPRKFERWQTEDEYFPIAIALSL